MAPSHSIPLSDALGVAVGIDNLKDYADAYKDFAVTLVVKDGVVHAEVTTPGIKIRCKFCADEAARVAVENP